MFMTYHLPAELQMFSDMRCHQPNCIAVEQANGWHVSAQSRERSLRVVVVDGHESFLALSNCGVLSIFEASFKFARASYLVSGEPWSTVRKESRAFGRFYVSSVVIGV